MAGLPRVIVVAGPTGSGKTRLAVALARRFGGEIISADSRQVYRGMDIGTGKDLREYGARIQRARGKREKLGADFKNSFVPYHLIDVVGPRTHFTVADFQRRAYRAIGDIVRRGKLPIICGGTGLYVDAVVKGYRFGAARIKKQESRKLRQRVERLSTRQLLELLKKIDPVTYRVIDRRNRRRVQRGVEIYYATGRPKSLALAAQAPQYDFLQLGIRVPSAQLYRRLHRRLEQRLRAGMIGEVQRLHRSGVSWSRLETFGLEYRWVSRYLRGQASRFELERGLFSDIKQFSRRQMTWFRRNTELRWVASLRGATASVRRFLRQ
ncbi:MAG: tRNA dimethylallyltransferase [Parcubacteria group bacterium Gr01-1014_31]|nr:MAG: tRNA dimethylallyltransferase [Parcubacteria group bacterium Gr01-1014_31]